jgi:hypothetical protein
MTKENPDEHSTTSQQKSTRKALLAVLVFTVSHALTPVYAGLGDQHTVLEVQAAKGWTAVVPININGNVLIDLLSYNRTTGQAVYSASE